MVLSILWDLYKYYTQTPVHNEVLFFHDKLTTHCLNHSNDSDICTNRNCYHYNAERIVSCLDKAQDTIDLCVFLLTLTQFSNPILRAKKRGVKVRVLTDHESAYTAGSKIIEFIKAGIPSRSMPSPPNIMHHKFCVIDYHIPERSLLLNGSLNWTKGSVRGGNLENVIITSDRELIEPYFAEFERLWVEFSKEQIARLSFLTESEC